MPNLLNIGCGSTYHSDWTNLDLRGGPGVMQHDVYQGLPFEGESFDAVYSAHLLEHLHRCYVPTLLRECWRVLRPGGLIRVAVPDLEAAARSYLDALGTERYEWAVIELIDQLCRHRPGGEMADYWRRDPMPTEDFVYERVGNEARQAVTAMRKHGQKPTDAALALQMDLDPNMIGAFRVSGEAHLWMYDRYSLRVLLEEAGFSKIRQCNADWSRIPNFSHYHLDIAPDGSVRKPDSLFMEGEK